MTERLDCFVTSLLAMTNVLCPSLRGTKQSRKYNNALYFTGLLRSLAVTDERTSSVGTKQSGRQCFLPDCFANKLATNDETIDRPPTFSPIYSTLNVSPYALPMISRTSSGLSFLEKFPV